MLRPILIAALASAAALPALVRAGDVVGTVRFTGAVPVPARLEVVKDRAVCGREVADESLLVSGAGLANVVLRVQGAPAPPPARAVLDQERCRYRPHVQVAPVGSVLEIRNGDELLHSVHGWEGRRTRFDIVTPSKGDRVPTKLDRAGRIDVRCDVHAWMVAYVVVVDAPAAVTAQDGSFAIRGVPAGTYEVMAWHERLGERTIEVTVPAQGEVVLDVAYGG